LPYNCFFKYEDVAFFRIMNLFYNVSSIENHCSIPQQVRMADILKEELKEMLIVEPVDDSTASKPNRLPSPKQLFGKIILKVI
jgi:hypothetical protein